MNRGRLQEAAAARALLDYLLGRGHRPHLLRCRRGRAAHDGRSPSRDSWRPDPGRVVASAHALAAPHVTRRRFCSCIVSKRRCVSGAWSVWMIIVPGCSTPWRRSYAPAAGGAVDGPCGHSTRLPAGARLLARSLRDTVEQRLLACGSNGVCSLTTLGESALANGEYPRFDLRRRVLLSGKWSLPNSAATLSRSRAQHGGALGGARNLAVRYCARPSQADDGSNAATRARGCDHHDEPRRRV